MLTITTFYNTHEAAKRIADECQVDDAESSYRVEHNPNRGHFIVVFDADGERLGTL